MEREAVFGTLLTETRAAYRAHPDLMGFAPFPDDVTPQPLQSYHCPCADWLATERGFKPNQYDALQDAIIAASPIARWRETYKGTNIGQDFMDRFGCYSIIGEGGPFRSERLWLWIVYMPPGLDYPWHDHPAEEIYLVVAGSAVFRKAGVEDQILHPGDTTFHVGSQPHAMETLDQPVLCLVAWRGGFETPPKLTEV